MTVTNQTVYFVTALKHPRQIACAKFSPDGKRVAAGGADEKIHVTALDGGTRALDGHETWIVGLAFAPDGRLFSADMHGVIHAWDPALEKRLWTSKTPTPDFLRAIATDGKTLVAVGDDRIARVRDAATGRILHELKGHESCVYAVACHPDGSFVTGDLNGDVLHWENGALKRKLDAKLLHTRGEDFLADVGGVRSFAFSPDGLRLAAGGMKDAKSNTFCPGTPTVLVFDWAGGERKSTHETGGSADGPVNALAYLPDGTLCGVSESHGGNAGLYFWKDGQKPAHTAEAPSAYDIDLHPDGQRLAIAAYASKGSGGNGRAAKTRAEYVPNEGVVRIYSLFDKPKPDPKKKP
jgi:WD40 repeat protein